MNHEDLLDEAKEAANRLFCDRSVSPSTTRESIENLIEYCEVMLDALESGMRWGGLTWKAHADIAAAHNIIAAYHEAKENSHE